MDGSVSRRKGKPIDVPYYYTVSMNRIVKIRKECCGKCLCGERGGEDGGGGGVDITTATNPLITRDLKSLITTSTTRETSSWPPSAIAYSIRNITAAERAGVVDFDALWYIDRRGGGSRNSWRGGHFERAGEVLEEMGVGDDGDSDGTDDSGSEELDMDVIDVESGEMLIVRAKRMVLRLAVTFNQRHLLIIP